MLKILTFASILSVNIFCLGADAPQVERIQEGIYKIGDREVTIQELARLSKPPIEISGHDEIKFGDTKLTITYEEIDMIGMQNKLSIFISKSEYKNTEKLRNKIDEFKKIVAATEDPLKAIISARATRAS